MIFNTIIFKIAAILCDASGSQKSKMAAHKNGILISQLVYNRAAKFLKLNAYIRGTEI